MGMNTRNRLKEFTAPTGEEELLDVEYPTPRLGVSIKQAVILGVVLVAGLVGYVLWSRPALTSAPEQAFPSALVASSAAAAPPSEVVVSVVGEVERPGLVTLAPDARIADALAHAGPKPEANILAVNQAQKVTDGMQIVVPPQGQPVPIPGVLGANPAVPGSGPTSLNTASAEELQQLPGVGEKTAQAIIEFRETHGGFASVDQLQEVKGIGSAKLEQVKDLVTL